jgi:ketosteroid isomerase-like protein
VQAYVPGIRPFLLEARMSINTDNTRKAYKAFGEGDLTTLTELIAPDCVWHVGGRSQLTGDYVGHDEIFGYFGKLMELTDGTFQVTLDDVGELESSGMVTCLVTVKGSREGRSVETRMVEIGKSNGAGQVAECWWFPEDMYAGDEFFGPAQIVLPEQAASTEQVVRA